MKLPILIACAAGLTCSAAALADQEGTCHLAFGNGVAEQSAPFAPWTGTMNFRIGTVVVPATFAGVATEGFDDPDWNDADQTIQLTGFFKGTYDFGPKLGTFHFWEVDTLTFPPDPTQPVEIIGRQLSGPQRDAVPSDPAPWGTGYFADTDADMRARGWITPAGQGSAMTFFVWGNICNVDLVAIAAAQ